MRRMRLGQGSRQPSPEEPISSFSQTRTATNVSVLLPEGNSRFIGQSLQPQLGACPPIFVSGSGNGYARSRKQQGWTQVYMAEHVSIDRSFISDLENGKKEIPIRNLEVLAGAFRLTVSQL